MLYLNRADIEGLNISMKEVLEVVDNGFRLKGLGKTEMPSKTAIYPRKNCFVNAMPAYVREVETAGLKWVSTFPDNLKKSLPCITGLLILNSTDTGLPIAIMDCTWITAMRTGASAGISAKYLAKPGSTSCSIIGCGVQARTTLTALVETCADLQKVHCYDLYQKAAENFIDQMTQRFPQLEFVISQSPTQAALHADIVVSAIPITTDPNPPLDAGVLKDGALAVSLDYGSPWTSQAMKECEKFVSDDINQLLKTKDSGVYFGGIPETIYADLGELAAGLKTGRHNNTEKIFCMNMGIAVDDMVTAKLIFEKAKANKTGTSLPL